MSAEAPAFVRSWRVGARTVTLTVPTIRPGQQLTAVSEWAPDMPKRMTEAEITQYVAGRNRALQDMAFELRLNVAVLDV